MDPIAHLMAFRYLQEERAERHRRAAERARLGVVERGSWWRDARATFARRPALVPAAPAPTVDALACCPA